MKVTSPQGNSLHTVEKVETGQFAFTAAEDGDYMACFWAEDHSPQIIMTVDFDWRSGVQAKDWSNVAKKEQVDVSLFCFSLLLTPTIIIIGMSHKIIEYQKLVGAWIHRSLGLRVSICLLVERAIPLSLECTIC